MSGQCPQVAKALPAPHGNLHFGANDSKFTLSPQGTDHGQVFKKGAMVEATKVTERRGTDEEGLISERTEANAVAKVCRGRREAVAKTLRSKPQPESASQNLGASQSLADNLHTVLWKADVGIVKDEYIPCRPGSAKVQLAKKAVWLLENQVGKRLRSADGVICAPPIDHHDLRYPSHP